MKRRMIDLVGICVCLAVIGVAVLYPDQVRGGGFVTLAAGILFLLFLILAIMDSEKRKATEGQPDIGLPSEPAQLTEIVLLGEEDTERMVWDLYGKTAMVIGRDVKENQVDIDLNDSVYASMVDIEHAVLNYSAGNWYVEDLGSINGLSVKKAGDGRNYRLSADTPCRLERGDCLHVGRNRLLLR